MRKLYIIFLNCTVVSVRSSKYSWKSKRLFFYLTIDWMLKWGAWKEKLLKDFPFFCALSLFGDLFNCTVGHLVQRPNPQWKHIWSSDGSELHQYPKFHSDVADFAAKILKPREKKYKSLRYFFIFCLGYSLQFEATAAVAFKLISIGLLNIIPASCIICGEIHSVGNFTLAK